MVAAITTTLIITIVVTAAVIVVFVDGFVIVVHNLPPSLNLSRSPLARWPPCFMSSSVTIELKSSTTARNGRWKKRREQGSLLPLHSMTTSTSKTSTTNNDENHDDDATPSTARTTAAKEKYLQLAREAYTQYFSSSDAIKVQNQSQQQFMSLDEYLDLAVEAWNVTNDESRDGGRSRTNVVPYLLSRTNYAATTSSLKAFESTSYSTIDASRVHFESSVINNNNNNNNNNKDGSDLHNSNKICEKQKEGQSSAVSTSKAATATATTINVTTHTSSFSFNNASNTTCNSASFIGGGGESSKTIDGPSVYQSFLKGWIGTSLGINNSLFGEEFSSSSIRNKNPIPAMLSSIMLPFIKDTNNDDDVDSKIVQNVDSKERHQKQIQQPLRKYLSQPPPQLTKTMVALAETTIMNEMKKSFKEGFISGGDKNDNDGGTRDEAATVAMPGELIPGGKRPLDYDSLNDIGGVIRNDGRDVNEKNQNLEKVSDSATSVTDGNEAFESPPALMIPFSPLEGQQRQQQRLSSLSGRNKEDPEAGNRIINRSGNIDDKSNDSDDAVADISASGVISGAEASPPITPSTKSPVLQRSKTFTPKISIPAVVPLRGSFNIMTQADSPNYTDKNQKAKAGRTKSPLSTRNRAKTRSMPQALNRLQGGARQQQAPGIPSEFALKGSAPNTSKKVVVDSSERLIRWGGSTIAATNESFNSNQDMQSTNNLEDETTGATISDFGDLMRNNVEDFDNCSEDVTASNSIVTMFPSGEWLGLPSGIKAQMASPAHSLLSQNWESITDNQDREPTQGPQFPTISDLFEYEKDDHYPSTGWTESFMGWDGDGLGDVNTVPESKEAEDELGALTSRNGIPEPAYFPSLHIGSRIRSTLHGTTHEGYLFTSDGISDGATGNSRYRVMPCIAKRPWSLSELNATVPTQVLAFERGQQSDSLQDQQLTLEPWELEAKAAAVRRYFEVEIHMFQKFEEKKTFFGALRRQQLQEEDVRDQESEIIKSGDAVIIMTKAEVTVPNFVRVYADDGSGGPNMNDAIAGYGTTGFDVWGKELDPGHEWLVYEGRLETEVTLLDAMIQGRMNDGTNRLCGVQRSMNLPETFAFGDVLDSACLSLLEGLVFLSSCNVVHRDIRTVNILCDSEHHRLRLTNFGNAVDLDPPRVGLDNDRLVVDIPVSIANTLAADVFAVAIILCHLMFGVPEKSLNRQLKGVGYDLDLWLQQALTEELNSEKFLDAFDYLRERRGFWSFLKGAVRPNPLRKKITSDSLRQFDEILALKRGDINWTEGKWKKVAEEEAYLVSILRLPENDFGEGSNLVQPNKAFKEMEANEVTAPVSSDDGTFDITRVPFTLQPPTKLRASVLSELSKKIKQSAPDALTFDGAPPSFGDSEYSDLTRIQFSPTRKSSLTDMLTSYSKQKRFVLETKREALQEGSYYDITRAPFQKVSPQLTQQRALAIAIRLPDTNPEYKIVSEAREVKQIVAPPGKLGVVVDTSPNEGPAYVSSIRDDSPLLGRIFLGDLVIAVDDLDVQMLVADEVSKILLAKSTNARRTISVLRKIENIMERQVDLGGQLVANKFDPGSSIAEQHTLADDKYFYDVERWILGILPNLRQEDVAYYCKCLISDGFDSFEMLEELMVDDLYFMKKAHKRVVSRRLFKIQEQPPPEMMEESYRVKKVYTVDEALGMAARKGIEATVAEEKRLAVEKEKRKVAKQKTNDGAQGSVGDASADGPIIKQSKE